MANELQFYIQTLCILCVYEQNDKITNGPAHEMSVLIVSWSSECSGESANMHILTRAFTFYIPMKIVKTETSIPTGYVSMGVYFRYLRICGKNLKFVHWHRCIIINEP